MNDLLYIKDNSSTFLWCIIIWDNKTKKVLFIKLKDGTTNDIQYKHLLKHPLQSILRSCHSVYYSKPAPLDFDNMLEWL